MAIEALFFDVGNTLLFPSRKKMLYALHARQVFPSEELLQQIERETKREFDALVESHSAVDHGFWWMFYSRLLDELGKHPRTGATFVRAPGKRCSDWPSAIAWQ